GARVGPQHVERRPVRQPQALALADREVVVAAVLPQHLAARAHDLAAAILQAPVAAQERARALAGEEAEVLSLALAGDGRVVAGGERAHLVLAQLGEREAQPR